MPRPRSSTFYLPLAPSDAPLSLKAKLSVLPPSAANALLAPRTHPSSNSNCHHHNHSSDASTTSGCGSNSANHAEDECERLERVLGLREKRGRRHTDAPLPSAVSTALPPPPSTPSAPSTSARTPLCASSGPSEPSTPALSESSSCSSTLSEDAEATSTMEVDAEDSDSNTNVYGHSETNLGPLVPPSSFSHTTTAEPEMTSTPRAETQTETAYSPVLPPAAAAIEYSPQPGSAMEFETDSHSTMPTLSLSLPSGSDVTSPLLVVHRSLASGTEEMEAETIADPVAYAGETEPALDLSSSDMDSFAGACDILNSFSPSSTPLSTDTNPAFGLPSPHHRPSSVQPELAPPQRPRLSNLPCGILPLLACRPKYPSPLSLSTTVSTDDSDDPSGDSTAPSTSSTESLPRLTTTTTTTYATSWQPLGRTMDALTSRSLHPLDWRHLLPVKWRMSYPPPPPPPCPAVGESEGQEPGPGMMVGIIDPCTPGVVQECPVVEDADLEVDTLASLDRSSGSDSTSSSPSSSSSSSSSSLGLPARQPARQRFRTPPSTYHRLLRRSLGSTAWERAETLACARLCERRFGVALKATTGLGGHLNETGSLSWNYGDSFGMWATTAAAPYEEFEEDEWDMELESEGEGEGQDMECEDEDEDGSSRFVRESAPEPEDRPACALSSVEGDPMEHAPEGQQEKEEDGGFKGYSMIGRFTWDKDWSSVELQSESCRPSKTKTTTDGSSLGADVSGHDRLEPIGPSASASTPTTASSTASTSDSADSGSKEADRFWDMDEDGFEPSDLPSLDTTGSAGPKAQSAEGYGLMFRPGEPPQDVEEDVFRYSPLRVEGCGMEVEVRGYQHQHSDLCTCPNCCASTSQAASASIPPSLAPVSTLAAVTPSSSSTSSLVSAPILPLIPMSPSFPPPPMVGTKVSTSCSDSEDLMGSTALASSPPRSTVASSSSSTPPSCSTLHRPKPLSLVQQARHPAYVNEESSPTSSVFVIPPSPLGNAFGEGGRTPTNSSSSVTSMSTSYFSSSSSTSHSCSSVSSMIHTHVKASSQERLASRRSMERITSRQSVDRTEPRQSFGKIRNRPSFERIGGERRGGSGRGSMDITDARRSLDEPQRSADMGVPDRIEATTPPVFVAPRPRRASRALEGMFGMESPKIRAGSLPQSNPPLPTGGGPPKPATTAWTFGSLKNALSNSVERLVEMAKSRSPSPLPWLIRGTNSSTAHTTPTQRSTATAEELESERSVTPTPTTSDRSRRGSTATLTGPNLRSNVKVPQLQLDLQAATDGTSGSPPPKRTLSTSSLSSLSSEPDSESGSSGGMFSRSPSPEPSAEKQHTFDPSYSLTPRSRSISTDPKLANCGNRLSPMMIPGSWDPEELWTDLQ